MVFSNPNYWPWHMSRGSPQQQPQHLRGISFTVHLVEDYHFNSPRLKEVLKREPIIARSLGYESSSHGLINQYAT